MKSLEVIGTEVTIYLVRETLDGVIVEIDNDKHFSHKVETDSGCKWVSLDQLDFRQK